MAVTPTGPISVPLAAARTLLASLSAWQTWCGAEDAAEAAEFIHLVAFDQQALSDEDKLAARPLIALWGGDNAQADRIADPNTWSDSGDIDMAIVDLVGEQETAEDQYLTFTNNVGAVMDELRAASGIGALNVTVIRRTSQVQEPNEQRRAEGHINEYEVRYSLEYEG